MYFTPFLVSRDHNYVVISKYPQKMKLVWFTFIERTAYAMYIFNVKLCCTSFLQITSGNLWEHLLVLDNDIISYQFKNLSNIEMLVVHLLIICTHSCIYSMTLYPLMIELPQLTPMSSTKISLSFTPHLTTFEILFSLVTFKIEINQSLYIET